MGSLLGLMVRSSAVRDCPDDLWQAPMWRVQASEIIEEARDVGGRPVTDPALREALVQLQALALPVSETLFVALVILVFGVEAVLYTVAYPLSVDGADRSLLGHGVVLGIVNFAWGIGAVVGPLAGSGLSGIGGSDGAYVVLAVFSLGACLFVRARTASTQTGVAV